MTDVETRQTAELLKEINRDRTVVVVEHDMTFVRELGVKVTACTKAPCSRKARSTRSPRTSAWSRSIWDVSNAGSDLDRSALRCRASAALGLAVGRAGQGDLRAGRNGVGKTSLLDALAGQHPISKGAIIFDGADITRLKPSERARRGIAYVPQGREIFPLLTVEENLKTGFAPLKREDRSIPDDVSPCSRCSTACWAAAAAISPAANSSSSRSAGRW